MSTCWFHWTHAFAWATTLRQQAILAVEPAATAAGGSCSGDGLPGPPYQPPDQCRLHGTDALVRHPTLSWQRAFCVHRYPSPLRLTLPYELAAHTCTRRNDRDDALRTQSCTLPPDGIMIMPAHAWTAAGWSFPPKKNVITLCVQRRLRHTGAGASAASGRAVSRGTASCLPDLGGLHHEAFEF